MDNRSLDFFRTTLLGTLLLVASFFSFFIATLSVVDILPMPMHFIYILYVYCMINISAYYILQKNPRYYLLSMNISIIASLLSFTILTFTVFYDEFRLIWFFLTSFAAFILGGRRYGIVVTTIIIVTVLTLHLNMDIKLSNYVIFTFISTLFIFNIFSHFFLDKIEKDSHELQSRVIEEVEKRQAQEQMLLHQYRMTNMGEMIDAIAHQWRQPLMHINMILLNMDDSLDDKNYLRKSIDDITHITEHMSQTIEDFRSLLREDKTTNSFDIDKIFQDILGLMKNNLADIKIEYQNTDTSTIVGYKNELIQVLIIILSNAIEALTEEDIQDKEITIKVEKITDNITITIEDNAGGIAPDIIEKVCEAYFTTKENSSGSGLGLYIAHIIVTQNMKGTLTVSNTNKGAKFTIEIKQQL